MIDLGIVKPGSTIYIPWGTYDGGTGASLTMTGLAVGDIQIYKDGGVTQRASTAGFTLLDTDGTDFDTLTGIHGVSIDLADNTTANFYEAGSRYWVVISSVTIDAQTVSFVAATFVIGYPGAILDTTIATLASQISFTLEDGSVDNDAYNGCVAVIHDLASAVQVAIGYVTDYVGSTKTVSLGADPGIFTMAAGDSISLFPPANVTAVAGTAQTAGNITSDVAAIESELILVHSETTAIQADANNAYSDTTVIEAWALGSVASDTAAIESELIVVHSETTATQAEVTQTHSETTVIQGWGLASVASDTAAIETTTTNIYSDTTIIYSDTTVITSDTAVIEVDTGNIYSDTTIIHSDTIVIESDSALVQSLVQISGSVSDAAPTASDLDGNAALSATDDFYNGMMLVFTSGTYAGIARRINDYTGASKNFVFSNVLTGAPGNGDTFNIVSPETSAGALTGAQASDLAAIESELILVHSETTVIQSDTTVVEAWGLGSVASDTAAIETDTGNIYSDTTIIYSDTTAIHSDTTIIHSDTIVISSDTAVIEADTANIYSDTTVIESDSVLVQNLVQITGSVSDNTPTASDFTGNAALSATADFYNGLTLIFTSGTYAGIARRIGDYSGSPQERITFTNPLTGAPGNGDTFAIFAHETSAGALTASQASDLVAIESELILVHSETTIIQSDTTVIEAWGLGSVASDTAAIEVDTGNIYSDTTIIHSDTIVISSDTAVIEADTANIYSDTTVIESDSVLVQSLVQISGSVSDAAPTASDLDGNAALSATDDFYNGMMLVFTSGTYAGVARRINDYTGASKNFVFSNALTGAPGNGDTFNIVSPETTSGALSAAQASDLAAIESELILVHSETTVIQSDTTVVEGWGLGSVASDTAVIETTASNIYSDTTIIYSDTTAIHSDTTIIHSDTIVISSDTAVVETTTTNIYSDTTIAVSDTAVVEGWGLGSVASDTAAIETDTGNIYSDTTIIASDVVLVQSLVQLTGTVSDAAPTASDFAGSAGLSATDDFYNGMVLIFTSGTYAGLGRQIKDYTGATKDIVLENSLTAAPTNGDAFSIVGLDARMTAAQASDLVAIESELIVTHSETTAIQSDTTIINSDTVVIEGWGLGSVASDAAAIESELIIVHSETTVIVSDTTAIHSDTTIIHSDTIVISSDTAVVEARLLTDTITEMSQQQPPQTPTWEEALMYLYMALTGRVDVTSSLKEFHNRAETVIWKKTVSDDGTTYSEDTGATGP